MPRKDNDLESMKEDGNAMIRKNYKQEYVLTKMTHKR